LKCCLLNADIDMVGSPAGTSSNIARAAANRSSPRHEIHIVSAVTFV